MKIYIGADHAGYELKETIKKWLQSIGRNASLLTTAGLAALFYGVPHNVHAASSAPATHQESSAGSNEQEDLMQKYDKKAYDIVSKIVKQDINYIIKQGIAEYENLQNGRVDVLLPENQSIDSAVLLYHYKASDYEGGNTISYPLGHPLKGRRVVLKVDYEVFDSTHKAQVFFGNITVYIFKQRTLTLLPSQIGYKGEHTSFPLSDFLGQLTTQK